jgi:hypothetical protein
MMDEHDVRYLTNALKENLPKINEIHRKMYAIPHEIGTAEVLELRELLEWNRVWIEMLNKAVMDAPKSRRRLPLPWK